jgi:glycosyltransferase involved in cell wall biosynthesis
MKCQAPSITVLHILGALQPSGMERMLASAANYFPDENITNVILGQGDDHPFADELRASGYDVRILNSVGASWEDARALRKLARELAVDVIHIHTEGNYLRTAIACQIALGSRGRLVRTVHSVFDAKGIWRVKRMIQALVADRMMSSLIAPSQDVAANEDKLGRKATVVYNWVDDRFFVMREARENRIRAVDAPPLALIVGNCSEIKHHELALRSLVPSTHLLIHLGDERGASPEELALLRELDDDGRLLNRGVHPPDAALRLADYFMMSSRHEGMGVALAEALVAGLPALVSDVPGLRWASGMTRVTLLPEDVDAWTRSLDSCQVWAQNAAPLAIDFSAARGAHEYADVYRAAIRRPSRTNPSLVRRRSSAVQAD